MDVYFFFDWLDSSWLASISKSYGGLFAMVQFVHLSAMAMLGGMILTADLRLLNVLLKDVPALVVLENTQRWINYALVAIVLSGIYMMSAVAIKLYYNTFFWSKMAGLALGLLYVYGIKAPMWKRGLDQFKPWVIQLVAATSLLIWFSVAASGRWIGFS